MIYPTKVNNVFTGWSLLEMYLILALCYVCYHLPTGRCETNVRIYFFQYMVYTIFYHNFNAPDVYERKLGLCVFMKLCLVYAVSR